MLPAAKLFNAETPNASRGSRPVLSPPSSPHTRYVRRLRAGNALVGRMGGCVALAFLLAGNLAGCAAYRVGNGTLYAPDVTTVYVPMVESDSFRRGLGELLTEAIVKEIELKTPYKVVGTPDADSVLAARLVGDTKRVIVENPNDDPRVVEVDVYADVTWINRRREPLCPAAAIPLPPQLVPISQSGVMIAEAGQSIASQELQAIQRLAEQIVATMEEPW